MIFNEHIEIDLHHLKNTQTGCLKKVCSNCFLATVTFLVLLLSPTGVFGKKQRDPEKLTVIFKDVIGERPDEACVCMKGTVGVEAPDDNDSLKKKYVSSSDSDDCGTVLDVNPEKFFKEHRCKCGTKKEEDGDSSATASRKILILLEGVEGITGVTLSEHADSMEVRLTELKTKEVHARVLGGDYWSVPIRVSQVTHEGQFYVDLSLVQRCVKRKVAIPEYPVTDKQSRNLMINEKPFPHNKDTDYNIPLTQDSMTRYTITYKNDGHVFEFPANSALPPNGQRIALRTKEFTVSWKRDCLAPETCPTMLPVDQAIYCDKPPDEGNQGKPTMLPVDQAIYCDKPSNEESQCKWVCHGPAQFPIRMHLSVRKDSSGKKEDSFQEQAWDLIASYPGQEMSGYVGESQRFIEIRWYNDDWKLKRSKVSRAEFAGDSIQYVEIRTPEGHLHLISVPKEMNGEEDYKSSWIRVPEMNCDGRLTYRFVGTRTFKEMELNDTEQKGMQGYYRIQPPEVITPVWRTKCKDRYKDCPLQSRCFMSPLRHDIFTTSILLGGGLQLTAYDDEPTRFNIWPIGSLEVIFLFRGINSSKKSRSADTFRLDLELRNFAAISSFPYCSNAGSVGDDCKKENLNYWRMGLDVSLSFVHRNNLYWGFGIGVGVGITAAKKDIDKIPPRALVSRRIHIGWNLSRRFRLELQYRFFGPERVHQTLFDDAGVYKYNRLGKGFSDIVLLGLRVDEIF